MLLSDFLPTCLSTPERNKRTPTLRFCAISSQVTTYDDLLDYLQAKCPSIHRYKLPFQGANVVLFSYGSKNPAACNTSLLLPAGAEAKEDHGTYL